MAVHNFKKKDGFVAISEWMKEPWFKLQGDMIIRSLKKCCISNDMDGNKDEAIFEKYGDDDELYIDDIHLKYQ